MTDTVDGQHLVLGHRHQLGHLHQGRVVEHHVGRHLFILGNLLAQTAQLLEQPLVVVGIVEQTAALLLAAGDGLQAWHRQGQRRLTAQHGAGRLGQLQHQVAGDVLGQQPLVDQLADHAHPVFVALILADAVGRQLVVTVILDALVERAPEHLHHITYPEGLTHPPDAGERLLGIFGAVITLGGIQADVAVATRLVVVLAEVVEQHLTAAGLRLGEGRHHVELVLLHLQLLGVFDVVEQASHPANVGGIIEQQRLGRGPIAAGPAGLLIVGFDILGDVVVHHEAHVGLVDPHAKRHRRHHYLDIVLEEGILGAQPLIQRQARMIGRCLAAMAGEPLCHFLHPVAAGAIDDAAVALLALHVAQQLLGPLELLHQAVTDVGPVEAGGVDEGIVQFEAMQHVAAGRLVGSGGERHHRHLGEPLLEPSQRRVFGPKIVAPLGDAVGLVDGEQPEGQLCQSIQKLVLQQPFGGDIDQLDLATAHGGKVLDHLLPAQGGVDIDRCHAVGPQAVHLILHQRNEGRDHHSEPGAQQRRDLVTEGLAATGGLEHQGIAPRHYLLDDLELARPKLLVAEDRLQQGKGGIGQGVGNGGHGLSFGVAILKQPPPTINLPLRLLRKCCRLAGVFTRL